MSNKWSGAATSTAPAPVQGPSDVPPARSTKYRIETKAGRKYEIDLADGDNIDDIVAGIEAEEAPAPAPVAKAPAVAPPAPPNMAPVTESRGIMGTLSDAGAQLGKGVNTILGAVPNLVDPSSSASKFFNDNADYWDGQQTDVTKTKVAQADVRIREAAKKGLWEEVKTAAAEYATDPVLAQKFITETLPSMIPAIGAARAAQLAAVARGATAAKAASVATTAAGGVNAVLNAGGGRQGAYQELVNLSPEAWANDPEYVAMRDGGLSHEEAATERAKSKSWASAAVGGLTGALSGKTGLEAALFGGAGKAGVKAAAKRLGVEAAGEQMEEVTPQLASNIQALELDDSRNLTQGLGQTAVQTAIGAGPGSVLAAVNVPKSAERQIADEIQNQVDSTTFTDPEPGRPRMTNFTPADSLTTAAGLPAIVVPEIVRPQGEQDVSADSNVGPVAPGRGEPAGRDIPGSLVSPGLPVVGGLGGVDQAADIPVAGDGQTGLPQRGAGQQSAPVALPRLADRATDSDLLARVQGALPQPEAGTPAPSQVMMGRSGKGYGTEQDATVAMQVGMKRDPSMDWKIEPTPDGRLRVAAYAKPDQVTGEQIDSEWSAFAPESGTLNVPRAEMPQIKAEHRGAMTNFLKARGVESEQDVVSADSLKPTQSEFSPAKVEKAKSYVGGDRSILVSADGYVVDGHHQWLAKRESGEDVKVIRLKAPISELLATVKEFPSAEQSDGATPTVQPSGEPFATEKGAMLYAQQQGIKAPIAVSYKGGVGIAPQETTSGTTERDARTGRAGGDRQQPAADVRPATDGSDLRIPAAGGARASAQRAIDDFSAKTGVQRFQVGDPQPEDEAAIGEIADVLGSQFPAAKIVGFSSDDESAPNGFSSDGFAFVNTSTVQLQRDGRLKDTGTVDVSVPRTALHEFKHIVEKIAAAERSAGLNDTPAQQFTASIESIFDEMTDDGKRAYVENFLYAGELAAITDGAQRETRIQNLMGQQLARSEMTADFLGNRAQDKEFWKLLAARDPKGFKGFVEKWLSIISNLSARLQGSRTQGKKESARVDRYVRDLGKAKMVAMEALIAYRRTAGTPQADVARPVSERTKALTEKEAALVAQIEKAKANAVERARNPGDDIANSAKDGQAQNATEETAEQVSPSTTSISDPIPEGNRRPAGPLQGVREEDRAATETAVEPAPDADAQFSNRQKPTFYSQLERQISAAKMATQPGGQWQAWLNANAAKLGIKKDEIEWSGISDYLDMRADEKITKAEIVDYLQANGVQIEEVGKGGRTPDALNAQELLRMTMLRTEARGGTLSEKDQAEFAELKRRDDAEAEADIKPTKYGKYTLPGGREYRELLLTLPTKYDGTDYRSSHWDEDNIVAHIRYNDRTDAAGARVLFIEELQSDYGQAKRKGEDVAEAPFIGTTEGWLQLGIKRMIVHAVQNGYDKVAFVNGEQSAQRYDLSKSISRVVFDDNSSGGMGKPDMEGEVRAGVLSAYDLDDNKVIDKYVSGEKEIEAAIGKEAAKRLVESQAKEARSAGTGVRRRELSGLGLSVGGEGMMAFYDKIVPQNVNDVLKKLGGGKVESVTLVQPKGRPTEYADFDAFVKAPASVNLEQQGFTITDAMREKVADGVPMFSNRQAQVAIQGADARRYQLADETRFEEFRRYYQDYFLRVQTVQETILAQGGAISEAQDVYMAEELSYGRVQEQMKDFKDKIVKPLLQEVEKADLTLAELAMYAYAKHARERNQAMGEINPQLAPGTGSGMTDKEASDILNKFRLDGKDQALADLQARLMAITSTTRQLLLAEGLITTDEFTAWDSKYENYVPLRGFVEDETDVVDGMQKRHGKTAGKGFNIRGAESTRALGRTSLAGHVIENIFNDYERAVARVERNDVAKVFLNLITTNPDPDLWEIDAVRTTAAFNKGAQTVTYNQLIDKGEDTVSVKVGGKEVYIKVKDPLLVRAMRQAATDESGVTMRRVVRALARIITHFRNVLTRYSPYFGVKNAVRDYQTGAAKMLAILGPEGAALYTKYYATSGAANARNEFDRVDTNRETDREYLEFRAAGGTTGGYHMRDAQEMRKELQNLVVEFGGVPVTLSQKLIANEGVKPIYKAGKTAFRALELVGALSENQARFAAFRAARKMGKSPAQAASIAKNLTTNFNRKGEYGTTMNSLYLFFNASAQGTHNMATILKKNWGKAAMAGLSGLAYGLAMLAVTVGGDDDDGEALWDKIPQFEKNTNFIIMLPPAADLDGAERVGKTGRYIKIPSAYGLNFFMNLGYTMADLSRYAADKTRGVAPGRAAINTVSSMFGAFNPIGGAADLSDPIAVTMAAMPTFIDVPLQFGFGVDGFARKTSQPRGEYDREPDSERFGPSMAGTWEQRLATWLNESTGGDVAASGAIDLNPGTIRNLNKNLTGGVGDFVSSVFVNVPSKLMAPEAEIEYRDIPFLKAFYGQVDDATNLTLYYERKEVADKAYDEATLRLKKGKDFNYTKLDEMMQDLGKRTQYYTGQMTQLRKAELEIIEDEMSTKAEKTLKLQIIKKERGALAREFNMEYMDMRREAVK
ncbi:MAG: LPD38 domain-containing protein [Pseudomonadota bacterium]